MTDVSPLMIGAETTDTETSFLLVRLGNEHYAIQGTHVREIMRWREPLQVPGAPPALPGIISQRGVVLPVVDMRLMLGFPDTPPDRTTRYVLVSHNDVEMAWHVDAVADLVTLPPEMMEPVPATLDAHRARLLKAVSRLDDAPVAVLEPGAVVNALRPEIQ